MYYNKEMTLDNNLDPWEKMQRTSIFILKNIQRNFPLPSVLLKNKII